MIRWKYVAPRLVLLALVVLFLWLGLSPLVRWTLISVGQSVTSAKVEIGEVDALLLATELRLKELQIANPNAPDKNLLEASQVSLDLDGNALMRRKLVVREGRISGLRFGTDRETSGALEPTEGGGMFSEIDAAELGQKCLGPLADLFEQELSEQAEQLESVRLAKALMERWPVEYERMLGRTDSLRSRVERLRAMAQSRDENPLRILNTIEQATAEATEIEREIGTLRSEIDRLQEQARVDREAIAVAKQHDLERIRTTFRVENLNAKSLSRYFLGPEMSQTLQKVAQWVRWGRDRIASRSKKPPPGPKRGIDIHFPGIRKRPDLLIESLVLDGAGQAEGKPFQFLATATDLTSQPAVHGKPALVRAQVQAGTVFDVEAILDHTGETPHERITFNCPGLARPERVLGEPDGLAVHVSPGSTHLWASLDLKGDTLGGQILVKQGPVELVPDIPGRFGGERLADSLREALREVQEIRVVAALSGTLSKPHYDLQSNLGRELAAQMNGLLKREFDARREELARYVEDRIGREMAQLEQLIAARREEILNKLDLDGAEVGNLHQAIAQRIRTPDSRINRTLNKALPEGLPLRF